jgi:hypothetical protein
MTFGVLCFAAPVLALGTAIMLAAESSLKGQESPQGFPRGEQGPRRIFRDRVTPHWFAHDQRFWYRNDLRDAKRPSTTRSSPSRFPKRPARSFAPTNCPSTASLLWKAAKRSRSR